MREDSRVEQVPRRAFRGSLPSAKMQPVSTEAPIAAQVTAEIKPLPVQDVAAGTRQELYQVSEMHNLGNQRIFQLRYVQDLGARSKRCT
jgi:hypothetical protein